MRQSVRSARAWLARKGPRWIPALALVLAAIAWILVVGAVFRSFEDFTEKQTEHERIAQEMLTAMLDQETGIRGFMLTDDSAFLEPYRDGVARFDRLVVAERGNLDDDGVLRRDFESQVWAARLWQRLAVAELRSEAEGTGLRSADAVADAAEQRRDQMDEFRRANAEYKADLGLHRQEKIDAMRMQAILVVIGFSALVFGGALAVTRLGSRRELRYRRAQGEFVRAIQAAEGENEADSILKRHIERELPKATAHVLRRNASDDRLEAGTPVPAGSPLDAALEGARPRDCLAIRTSQRFQPGGDEPLVPCAICGGREEVACQPLLVGGRVIGSVLVEGDGPAALDSADRRIADSVAYAAPVMANLRAVARAKASALVDPLTGLANRRALDSLAMQLSAQAASDGKPLAAVMLDLDHFKRLNDRFGHDVGDRCLAATGRAIASAIRDDDVAARSGGEEFVVLLPGADGEMARAIAERIRRAVSAISVPDATVKLTISAGVAVMPVDAADLAELMRTADRAMYLAKRSGRNRVICAEELALADAGEADNGAETEPISLGR